jgi:hypothetical protein
MFRGEKAEPIISRQGFEHVQIMDKSSIHLFMYVFICMCVYIFMYVCVHIYVCECVRHERTEAALVEASRSHNQLTKHIECELRETRDHASRVEKELEMQKDEISDVKRKMSKF